MFQLRLLEIFTPKYLALLTASSTCPCSIYCAWRGVLEDVTITTWHLEGLNSISHLAKGAQSGGQHDGVHGFSGPVKSFITFVILSQISCSKVQKTLIFFCTRLCQSFFWLCSSFQDYLQQPKKKRKILCDWVHTSVVQGNQENCSKPRRNLYTVLCRRV